MKPSSAILVVGLAGGLCSGLPTRAAEIDITAKILANGGTDDIVLTNGRYAIRLPEGTTTYSGAISGYGRITVHPPATGAGSLKLTNTHTFTLPPAEQQETEKYTYVPGYWIDYRGETVGWWHGGLYRLFGDNDPVLTIMPRATVLFYTPATQSNLAWLVSHAGKDGSTVGTYNTNNIENNGTLQIFNATNQVYNYRWGRISGTGDFVAMPMDGRTDAGSFVLLDDNTYTGKTVLRAGSNIGLGHQAGNISGTTKIFNNFVLLYSPYLGDTTKVTQEIYEDLHGNSLHNRGPGRLVLTGTYNFSDSGDPYNPSLTNKDLNYTYFKSNASHRILYLYGVTQFGDGTDADFFLKGNRHNLTVSADGATIGFNYNGKVRWDAQWNAAPVAPSYTVKPGNLFVAGTPGNHVIVTEPQHFDGLTKIERNAVLQLGDGTIGDDRPVQVSLYGRNWAGTYSTSGGNGALLTRETHAPNARIVNEGTLIVRNTPGALNGVTSLTLSRISGQGRVRQAGRLPLTLTGYSTYTGGTTIDRGTTVNVGSSRGLGKGPVASAGRLQVSGVARKVVVEGTLDLAATASVRLRVPDFAAGKRDVLAVTGAANVSGRLVVPVTAAAPPVGTAITLISAGTIGGTFDSVSVPTGYEVRYTETAVRLVHVGG